MSSWELLTGMEMGGSLTGTWAAQRQLHHQTGVMAQGSWHPEISGKLGVLPASITLRKEILCSSGKLEELPELSELFTI